MKAKGFILRLDDACGTMDKVKWDRLTDLLDSYHIIPILGIIPDCKDPELSGEEYPDFWKWCRRRQDKGWIIAQHGYNHKIHRQDPSANFQKAIEKRTEFAGVPVKQQKRMIEDGLRIMQRHSITPVCFFAPCHTYDTNTISVLKKVGGFLFISDGYDFRPYCKEGMLFLPAPFDSFHPLWGLQTFILHPNNMTEADFRKCEDFLSKNRSHFLSKVKIEKLLGVQWGKQSKIGYFFENTLYIARRIRNFCQ